MNLPLLFACGVAAWLPGWTVFFGVAVGAPDAPARDPLTLLDSFPDPAPPRAPH